MAEAFVITLYETVDLASGETNVVKLDTDTTALWLRKYDNSGSYVSEHSLPSLGGASFLAEVADGRYQAWKSAYPDVTSGNRYDKWHGGATKFKWVGDKDLPYASLTEDNTLSGTNTFSGPVAINDDVQLGAGDFIYVTEDATENSQLPNLGQVTGLLTNRAKIDDDNTFDAGTTNTFEGTVAFTNDTAPTCTASADEDDSLITSGEVNTRIAGSAIGQQVSVNEIFLMPGGSNETNKIYNTYQAVFDWAIGRPPTSGWQIVITVKGMGKLGTTELTMLPSTVGAVFAKDYVHWNGLSRSIRLEVPDDTISCGALGRVKYSNLTFFLDTVGTGDPAFTNLEFENCDFDFTCTSATFTGCRFINCRIKVNTDEDGSATFTSCKYSGTTSNQGFGDWSKPKVDF